MLEEIEHIYRDVGGDDKSYDEFKQLCKKSWEEVANMFVLIDLKREIKEDTVFVMKTKTLL